MQGTSTNLFCSSDNDVSVFFVCTVKKVTLVFHKFSKVYNFLRSTYCHISLHIFNICYTYSFRIALAMLAKQSDSILNLV